MADFDLGFLAAIPEEKWEGSPPAQKLADLEVEINESDDPLVRARLRRVLASSLFPGTMSGGKLTIPREIVWLLQRENEEERDVTLIDMGDMLEIWPTRRWEEYLGGHLFRDNASETNRPG